MGGKESDASGHENKMEAQSRETSNGPGESNFATLATRFDEHLSHQAAICLRLEEIADALPMSLVAHDCLVMSRSILPVLKRAHKFEEDFLFPAILKATSNAESMKVTLERLRFEHLEDQDHAGELSDALIRFVRNPATGNVDSLAYMLRGFFESLRRHLAFDREHLLPLLRKQS